MKLSIWFSTLVLTASQVLAAGPQVTLNRNEVITGTSENNDIHSFKGIPFAEPPVGDLRFAPPVKYRRSYEGLSADKFSKSCVANRANGLSSIIGTLMRYAGPFAGVLQTFIPQISNVLTTVEMGEDCLYLNVYKPAKANRGDNLPVMFWIYGGSFSSGDGGMYDGNRFVQTSIDMNQPVIIVTHNYRLGPYGFLSGKTVKEQGMANNGLKDQRMALQWVADHIESFGGDPSKVTIFGESAGAMSTFAHMAAYGGNNTYNGKPLFRGAIMQSGSIMPMANVDEGFASDAMKNFASAAGCGNSDEMSTIKCLRNRSVDQLNTAQNQLGMSNSFYAWSPHTDGDFIPDHQTNLVKQGRFAKVPFIIGTQEDEATVFAPVNGGPQSEDDVRKFFADMFKKASSKDIDDILKYYPDDPNQGAPFGTGDNNNLSPHFKRIAAFNTDFLFNAPRRALLSNSNDVPRWNYFSNALHNTVPGFGTFHANDLIWQWLVNAGPYNAYRKYWISFATHLDPNVGSGLTLWPQYDNSKKTLNIGFRNLGTRIDDFRQSPIQFLVNSSDKLAV